MAGNSRFRWAKGLAVLAIVLGATLAWAADPPERGGLHIPQKRQVNFTSYLNDGAGYRWDVQYYLNIGQGTDNVYSGGLYCRVQGGNVSSDGRGWMNQAGDEIEIGPHSRGNCAIYRRCKVYRDVGLARWLDIFVNNTQAAQTVPVQIYTNTQSVAASTITSSGAGSFGPKDWAFITEHEAGRPSLLHIVNSPRSKLRARVTVRDNVICYDYALKLPPGGTAVLCYFEGQGRSRAELQQRLKAFRPAAALKDLSPEVRKLIVNFQVGDELEEVELDRLGTSDAVRLKNGDSIFGRIVNEKFTLEAFYGTLELPAEKVVGFVQVAGQEELVRAVLLGGQVLTGSLRDATLRFSLPTGGDLSIPFSRIRECSYCISKDKPEDVALSDPLIVLRTGDRLAFEMDALQLSFQTRHGTIGLAGKDLAEIRLYHGEGGVHRAMFRNGSKLAGLLEPEKIVLPLKLGPKLTVPRDMVLMVRFAGEVEEKPELSRAKLSNDDDLYGRLADERYDVTTDFGMVTVRPRNIAAMRFDPAEPAHVAVELWDGSTLRGHIQQEALSFALQPGPVLALHVGHVLELDCPAALPPEEIVKQVEKYVAMLSAANYKDREEAQQALERMGPKIAPLLQKHLQNIDPEARHRITVILETIERSASDSGQSPPARLVEAQFEGAQRGPWN